jgi:ATP-binding cassette subfamily C protein
MGLDSSFLSRLRQGIENYRTAIDAMMRNSALFTIADDLFTSGVLIAVLFFCTTFLTVDLAQVAIVGLLMSRILVQVGLLQKGQHTIDSTASVASRIVETLADYRRNAEFSFGGREVSLRHGLRFEGVSLGYDDKSVLRGIDLTIPAGTLCAIVGMSGGGKTTLVDGILGLLSPTTGRILVDGVDLTEANILAWRSRVGYVPQELVLFNDTVMANIVLSRTGIDEEQVRRALASAEALKFVDALPQGMHTPIGERGTALSGGQRQRLALARALVHEPDLLILDEATTALDPDTEAEICETLRHLSGSRTIIAVSHQPRVAQVADMIVQVSEAGVSQAPAQSLAKL